MVVYGVTSRTELEAYDLGDEIDLNHASQVELELDVDVVPQLAGDPSQPAPELRTDVGPPAAAERLLRWVLPLKVQEPILGDLAEMYADAAKSSVREARALYWWHALRSIVPVVMRWSVVATAVEWLRRWFGS